MSQHYSSPKRENDPHSLPNIEVFYMSEADIQQVRADSGHDTGGLDDDDDTDYARPGWYWVACFPGCMPDGPPDGPYATEQDAIDACRDDDDADDDDELPSVNR